MTELEKTLDASPLDAEQKRRLRQMVRLLTGLSEPSAAALARALGYDDDEHARGWELLARALGDERPLEHVLAAHTGDTLRKADLQVRGVLRRLDLFENRWFPRFRATARRFVPAADRDTVVNGFFADMPQQPEGPGVVGSVTRFVSRYEAFVASGTPGAGDVAAALAKRGLDLDVLSETKGLLAEARKLADGAPPAAVDPDEVQRVSKAQLEALEALNLWYIDWATTLRDELPYLQRVHLGLTTRRRTRNNDESGDLAAVGEAQA